MESIGEKLRLAREKNNFTIEQVSRDTHVARRFLKALEDEDFSVFPGETYAMGFLRNYAEYLGLNAEEFVGLYRNLKIQEQPLPMTELLQSRPRLNRRVLIVFIVAALFVVIGGGSAYLIHRSLSQGQQAGGRSPNAPGATNQDFLFQEEVRTKWFKQGDRILVPMGDKNYRVEIGAIGDTVTLRVPGGTVELTMGKERFIDLDSDTKPDLKVVWNDIDKTSAEKRASLGLYRVSEAAQDTGAQAPATGGEPAGAQPPGAAAGGQAGAQTPAGTTPGALPQKPQAGGTQPAAAAPTGQTPAAPKPQTNAPAGGQNGGAQAPAAGQPPATTTPKPQTGVAQPANTAAAGQATATTAPAAPPRAASTAQAAPSQPAPAAGLLAVLRAPEAGAIIIDMSFRDYCLFRFLVDTNDRDERFFQKGESFSLDGKSQITVWLSNAGAVRTKINGKDVDLGNLGEVATRRIAWRKDAAVGDYVLEVTTVN